MKIIDYFKYDWKVILTDIFHSDSKVRNWLIHPESAPNIFSKIDAEYMYWSKAKHYADRLEISENELWTFVKYQRSVHRFSIPILDGQRFTYSYTNSFQAKIFNIEQAISRINKELDPSHDDLMGHYYIDGLIEEAIATSQFEGARTKRARAKEMLQTGSPPQTKHEQMIKNAFVVSRRLLAEQKKIQVDTISDIHNQLIAGTTDSLRADDFGFRRDSVEIVDHHNTILFRPTADAQLIQKSMERLAQFLNNESNERHFIHPLIKAIVVHFWVAYIHPFYDGNGRTARMLFYWCISRFEAYELIKYVPISTILAKRRSDYENAYLFAEHDENDMNYFIHFNLELILESLRLFEKHLNDTKGKLQKMGRELQEYKLNQRQLSLVNHAIRHPEAIYTVYSHKESHQITRITATSDLRDLVQKEILTESKNSKTLEFRLSPAFQKSQEK